MQQPQHIINEDYRDYYIRKNIEGEMKFGAVLLALGVGSILLIFPMFLFGNYILAIPLLGLGCLLSYSGYKGMIKQKSKHDYHMYRNYDSR